MEQITAKREKRKSLLRIAIPIILSSSLQISYDITDMFWPMYLGCGLWMLTNADAPGEPL